MISVQELRKAVSYCNGQFIWLAKPGTDRESKRFNTNFAGKFVSAETDRLGYLRFQINGVRVKYHRAVFAYHRGHYPETVDHINRDRSDNRIENLRAATRSEQQWNKGNVRGCYKRGSRWVSSIKANGKRFFLGSFKTQDEAANAYVVAKLSLHNSKTL